VTFNVCSGCKYAVYCSSTCQGTAWAAHKPICKLKKKKRQEKEKEEEKEKGREKTIAAAKVLDRGSGSGLEDMGSILAALMLPQLPSSPQRFDEVDMYEATRDDRNEDLQQMLLHHGLDVNLVHPIYGNTASYVAAACGYVQCLSLLASHNADLSKGNKEGAAPIHVACQDGRYACLEVLLENGVSANLRMADKGGDTPLIQATQNGHAKCMALLLNRNADPNEANRYGVTAAHRACQDNYLKCLQLLSKRGADLDKKDDDGNSPLDLARLYKRPECVDFLLTFGASGRRVEDIISVPKDVEVQCFA
jgi:ankyrin repeat protein